MIWVKVCGLRSRADVAAAARAGADAVGFVTDPASSRYVAPADVAPLAFDAPLLTVLVTVDLAPAKLLSAAAAAAVRGVQPHGEHADEAARVAGEAGFFVLRPVPVADRVDLADIPADQVPLLDASRPGRHGGTGETFDWTLTAGIERDYVLAGGLGPDNVADAVRRTRPWGVDASTGLESAPGVKDHAKIALYVQEAKTA